MTCRAVPTTLQMFLPVLSTLAILMGAAADRLVLRAAAADATCYHAAVKQVADTLPMRVGNWLGMDTPVPPSAVQLLHPNLIVSRKYQNVATGRAVSIVIVQCTDCRDLIGHFPPVCYVNVGWTAGPSELRDWEVDDLKIHGTRYEFYTARPDRISWIQVDNFMVLPDGSTCPNLDGVIASARDLRKRHFGAAQVQVVADRDLPAEERAEFFNAFLSAARPLFVRIQTRTGT